jgi:hypothetical protein
MAHMQIWSKVTKNETTNQKCIVARSPCQHPFFQGLLHTIAVTTTTTTRTRKHVLLHFYMWIPILLTTLWSCMGPHSPNQLLGKATWDRKSWVLLRQSPRTKRGICCHLWQTWVYLKIIGFGISQTCVYHKIASSTGEWSYTKYTFLYPIQEGPS